METLLGIVVMTLLIVVLGPALWSSRLHLRDRQDPRDKGPKSGP